MITRHACKPQDLQPYATRPPRKGRPEDVHGTLCTVCKIFKPTGEIMDAAYCIHCHKDDLPESFLCRRETVTDLGAEREEDLVARYEGRCIRCCTHNHG